MIARKDMELFLEMMREIMKGDKQVIKIKEYPCYLLYCCDK